MNSKNNGHALVGTTKHERKQPVVLFFHINYRVLYHVKASDP